MSLKAAQQAWHAGDIQHAIAVCRDCLDRDRGDAAARALLARCLLAAGRLNDAARELQQALQRQPDEPGHYVLLGDLYSHGRRLAEALQSYEKALQLDPDRIEALNGAALVHISRQHIDAAERCLQRALAQEPAHPVSRRMLGLLHTAMVPRWHYPMVNDARRNAAFQQAIEKAVRPHSRVLDIGSGSGLLSLMAAAAGAGGITACEANPWLADVARDIVAANGYQDRITIVQKASQQLVIGEDLPAPAGILIAEVFDAAVIGEGVLDTYEHAKQHLATGDFVMIPCRAELRGALVSGEALWRQGGVGTVAGFDLSALNRFQPGLIGLEADRLPMQAMSEDVRLMVFEFGPDAAPTPFEHQAEIAGNRQGDVHALVYWMRLWLDQDICIDNRPDLGDGPSAGFVEHWGPMVKLLPAPRAMRPGDRLLLDIHHNRRQVTVVITDPETGQVLA